ncbi:hypothetical protein FQN57_004615 [Myotisia sp. PD_48]|nr:hypothetical protein FQN57_004615 [Myotisia sp. PD_48]
MTSSKLHKVAVYRPGMITVGWTRVICKTNDYIVKSPKICPGSDAYNEMHLDQMAVERQIYEHLGAHEGVISYLGLYNDEGAIKLTRASQGGLEIYITDHDMPYQLLRASWIRSLIKTFYYIHTRNVLRQDVKLNNILLHHDSVKVIDFANGAIFPLDEAMETICAQDPLSRVDLLGISCVMYSIVAWRVYNFDYFEDNCFPKYDEIPSTDGLMFREIIDKCWGNHYNNIRELYEDFQQLDAQQGIFPRVDFMLWCMGPPMLLFSSQYIRKLMMN